MKIIATYIGYDTSTNTWIEILKTKHMRYFVRMPGFIHQVQLINASKALNFIRAAEQQFE